MKTLTASEIADKTDGRLSGKGDIKITGVESLNAATKEQASFLANPRYSEYLKSTEAGVVLVPGELSSEPPAGQAYIYCENPSEAFNTVVSFFAAPPPVIAEGIHTSAVIDNQAEVGKYVAVGANAVIARGVKVADNTVIGAGAYLGEDCEIGENCLIYPNVTIRERCVLANNVTIHSGTVIGSDGFGYIPGENEHRKIPQSGIVRIDDDVEIGSQVAIDRARFGKTWIKRGVKIDNLVQIAHNVVIDELSFVVAQTGIAGSSHIGSKVSLAGQVGVAGHIYIGDESVIMAQSGISKDLPPKSIMMGSPAVDRKDFARFQGDVKKIGRMKKQIKELQEELAELKKKISGADFC
ncbi:MAG: UDP-3-O-(3-hydroxymyristoyl)glucosamine N-acyltransferase [Verrucomicrobiota bacterium]